MKLKRLRASPVLPVIAITALGCGHFQSEKDRSLEAAIRAGSLESVQYALTRGADPNAILDQGAARPLLLAILSNGSAPQIRKTIIEALLQAGADPSKQQKAGEDALTVAARAKDAELCERFCRMGVSPVRCSGYGMSALHAAAVWGDVDLLKAMLPYLKPGQIDAPSTREDHVGSALGMACGGGHLDAAKLLLDHGADPNFQGSRDSTPLMEATFAGNADLVELLLSHGAKVDLPFRNGMTPLAMASYNGNLDVMRVLIAHGADVNHQNKGGFTPMMDAATQGHQNAVDLLLKSGARPDIRSGRGLTAADYGKRRKTSPAGPAPESAGG